MEINNINNKPLLISVEKPQPKKNYLKNPILIVVILVCVIIVFFMLLISRYLLSKERQIQTSQSEENTILISPKHAVTPASIEDKSLMTSVNLVDIPPLFPGASWKLLEKDYEYSLGKNVLFIDYETVSLGGEEWAASMNNLTREDMEEALSNFSSYYGNIMIKKGWSSNSKLEGYSITPIAADGPGGSINGFIAINGQKIRIIALEKHTPIEDFGGIASCPCNIGFSVFVSEIISLQEALSRINK